VERLGIIGGGQLGRFLTLAAGELGVETIVVDPTPDCPASAVGARQIVADYDDPEAVRHLTRLVPVVTFEIERGPLDVLRTAPCRVVPAVETLALLKDKLRQRTTLAAAGLANPTFAAVHTLEEALAFGETVGYPLVIKRPQGGYDGRGIAFLESPAALIAWWRARPAGWTPPLLAEEQVDLARELAVMVVRAADGTCACYPVVETVQREGLCRRVIAPAPVSPAVAERAQALALGAITALNGVGVFGVELFLSRDGRVLLNEIAPRVHNSGHYTLDACAASQFQQQVRVALGRPILPTTMTVPVAVMVNLIATRSGPFALEGVERATALGARVYLYGKRQMWPGRKMGHVNLVGDDLAEVLARAEAVEALLAL